MLIRVRTKDGTERLQVENGATLGTLRATIATQLAVPLEQQIVSRSVQAGPVPKKDAAFSLSDDGTPLSALGVMNGDIVFLDYQMERENQAVSTAYEKDPFVSLIKEGELRQQGKSQWTLTNFLDYRSTKEFVLQAPPEPHSKFVRIDARATQTLINYMMLTGFQCKRVGYLYGTWVKEEGGNGIAVHAIFEPKQDCTHSDIRLLEDPEEDEKLHKVAQMLGLVRVGVVIAHPAREYVFSVKEIILAAKLHAAAVEADPENGKHFVTMKARPVLETEEDIDGVATIETYQMTDQCVELCGVEAFSESKTDPRVAKTGADCCFIVEKKEQRKATVEHFVARVFDTAQPFQSFLGSSFPVENRPTEPQTAQSMANYLRQRRGREPFLKTISDLHLLLCVANMLDMNTDMPVLCANVVEGKGDELDGFQMMINCYAGID
uniref:MPN domain-containing protein n=1 Tax=Haptolina ericina TaxID=156174 RepID=A0A7S3BA92_9EUKA